VRGIGCLFIICCLNDSDMLVASISASKCIGAVPTASPLLQVEADHPGAADDCGRDHER
jgi:hypothetical protein